MLQVGSVLKGYEIEAGDGAIGSVCDFLFDDRTWKIRWLVVNTGNWLTGRLVLVHPSAIGRLDYVRRMLPVKLTKARVEGSSNMKASPPWAPLDLIDNAYQKRLHRHYDRAGYGW